MPPNSQTSRLILEYDVDQSSLQRALAAEAELAAGFDRTAKQAVSVDQVGERINRTLFEIGREQAIDQIVQQFHEAEAQGVRTAESLQRVAEQLSAIGASNSEIDQVTRSLADMERQSKGSGGDGSSARSTVGTALLAAPGSGAVGVAGQGLNYVASLVEMTPIAAAATVAITGLSVGIGLLEEQSQASQRTVRASVEGLRTYYEAIESGTRSSIEAELEANQARLDVNINLQRELLGQIAETTGIYFEEFGSVGGVISAIADEAGTLGASGRLKVLYEALRETSAETQILVAEQKAYEDAIGSVEVATNSAAEAERNLINARISALGLYFESEEKRAQQELEIAKLRREGSSEAVEQQLQDAQDQIDIYQPLSVEVKRNVDYYADLVNTLRENTSRTEEQDAQLESLTATYEELLDTYNRFNGIVQDNTRFMGELKYLYQDLKLLEKDRADALREQLTAQAHSEVLRDAYIAESSAKEGLLKATQEAAKAASASQAKIDKINTDAQTKSRQAAEKAAADQDELEEQTRIDREEAEQKHADRLAEITRRANATIANAIYARDALAAYLALQKRQEDIDAEQKHYADQLNRLERAYDRQTRSIEKRLDDQLRAIETNAKDAIATEKARYQEEKAERDAAIQRAKLDLTNANNALEAIQKDYYRREKAAKAEQTTDLTLASFEQGELMVKAFESGVASGLFRSGASAPALPVPADLPSALSPEPASVFVPDLGSSALGGNSPTGLTINIPITGTQMTSKQIRRIADAQLNDSLKEAGWT